MKCAQCLLDYINEEDGKHEHFSWSKIAAAETILDGMAVCLAHFAERIIGEPT